MQEWELPALVDHRLPLGVVAVDRTGRITGRNHVAKLILDSGDGLVAVHEHLTARRASEAAELRRLVAAACVAAGGPAGGMLQVARTPPRRPLTVIVVPLGPVLGIAASEAPAAVVFVSDPDVRAQTWAQVLGRLYGLTPAETAVALLLLGGASVREIASRRRTSGNTVRTLLQRVLEKTGAHRQADLVCLLPTGAEPAHVVPWPLRRAVGEAHAR
jgi:DNA-binding CsgD family transcriptional regulator